MNRFSAAFASSLLVSLSVASAPAGAGEGAPHATPGRGAMLIHSHNDYAQKRPFWGAYEAGADSIEADVFLVDGDLLVAHTRRELRRENTLRRLYLEPLRSVMRKNGGRAYADGKPLQLLIDLKNGKPALDRLVEMVEKEGFRDCFDIAKNPSAARLTATGDHSKVADFLAYPGYVFFDVPPTRRLADEQYRRVPMISHYARAYTKWRAGMMADADKEKIRAAARQVHAKGARFRLWGFPDHPEAWRLARELGLDYVNTDRPAAAAAFLRAVEAAAAASPDGRNVIRLYTDPLAYEVVRDGVTVVAKAKIGMTVDGGRLGGAAGRAVPAVTAGKRSGAADAPVYKKERVDLSANEAFADFGAWGVRLVARNDGVAYRFETKMPGRIRVDGEEADLSLPSADVKCWGMQTGAFGCEESVPFSKRAGEIDLSKEMLHLPFACEVSGKYVLVLESDVRDYPIWNFGSRGDAAFHAKFAGAPRRVRKSGAGISVLEHESWLVETEGARTFPWRVFVLADAPAKFCEADIVWALAPAQEKGADFSWVRPGKVAWDWWNGFDNGMKCDTRGYERFIDFAAKNGLEYVVLDWYGYEVRFGFDIWKPCPAIDVDHLVRYAKERGVDLWHWVAFHQVYGQEERVAAHFARQGVKGFKVDFLDRGDADVARFMEKFAAACARNRMHVEYHGAYRPTGLHRRYPNVLNYEGIHGQEWMLPGLYRGDERGTMSSDVAACFLRMSAGPMDYTPGAMLNHGIGSGYSARGRRKSPGTLGTRCRQMAQVALYEAPLQMLCDSPTNYERNMECFSFMAGIPTVWKSVVGLAGTPDTMFVAARETRDGAWYAGGITTADARDCTLDTSFLGAGEWKCELFRDAGDAKEDVQRYVHETRSVGAGEKIRLHMAPGGGFVARLSRSGHVSGRPRKSSRALASSRCK